MSFAALLTQTATITTTQAATAGPDGDWVPGSPTTTTEPCRLEDGQSFEVFEGADRIVADALLFLGPDAAITGRDEVTVDTKRYLVVGHPAEMRRPSGVHHIEARLRRVDHG